MPSKEKTVATDTAEQTTQPTETKSKPAEKQVSVLMEYVAAVRDLAKDVEAANAKVGRDIARNKAASAVEKLKVAALEITEAAALDA